MSRTIAYHRPASIEDALDLLGSAGDRAAPRTILAGGTVVNATTGQEREVVDLQALGLDEIRLEGQSVSIGAMVRLQDLVDSGDVPRGVRDAAKSEQPSTMRTVATVGGTVGVRWNESVLLAALLAHEAEVTTRTPTGSTVDSLNSWLARELSEPTIVTEITVAAEGATAVASTGRTPADVPIVAAVGRRAPAGIIVALTGVSDVPVVVDPFDPTSGLSPNEDFRGSVDYRLELARVLTARVVGELSQ